MRFVDDETNPESRDPLREADRLFVSRQSDSCGEGAKGAIRGELVMEGM